MGVVLKNEDVQVHNNYFALPFHPRLLDETEQYDPRIAIACFPDALKRFRKLLPAVLATYPKHDQQFYAKTWNKSPRLRKEAGKYDSYGYGWRSLIGQHENGFVTSLCLDSNCSCICLDAGLAFKNNVMLGPGHPCVTMTLEDALKFAQGKEFEDYNVVRNEKTKQVEHVFVPGYTCHNVDNPGTSLMLRLWGIEYLNRMFEKLKL